MKNRSILGKILAQGLLDRNQIEEEKGEDQEELSCQIATALKKKLGSSHPEEEVKKGCYQKVEEKLAKAARKLSGAQLGDADDDNDDDDDDDDDDEDHHTKSSFPNLKYAKQKYKNMDSVLKYVDEDGDTKAVKLVIMNFND